MVYQSIGQFLELVTGDTDSGDGQQLPDYFLGHGADQHGVLAQMPHTGTGLVAGQVAVSGTAVFDLPFPGNLESLGQSFVCLLFGHLE
jgi:hypothetical protein